MTRKGISGWVGLKSFVFFLGGRGVNLSATLPYLPPMCIYTSHKSIVINIVAEMNVLLVFRPSMYVPYFRE